jgi:hypothetical protein
MYDRGPPRVLAIPYQMASFRIKEITFHLIIEVILYKQNNFFDQSYKELGCSVGKNRNIRIL